MRQIKCIDRTIAFSNIESIGMLPGMDFIEECSNISHIYFHPKGEKFFKKHFWSRKTGFNHNVYEFMDMCESIIFSAEKLVESMKNEGFYWGFGKFFCDDVMVMRAQVEHNTVLDCLSRKPTLVIRTKSGDTLYAVYDTDEEAKDVINRFNKRTQ